MKKLFILFLVSGLLNTVSVHAGGYYACIYDHDKVEGVAAASYNFLLPVGNFKKAGRGPGGYAKPGHGFEIEALYYFEIGERFRVGVGANMPFYFFPTNEVMLNPQLNAAFMADTIGHTQYNNPAKSNKWFAWGLGAEGTVMYTMEKWSLEGNLKIGALAVTPPKYTIYNANYVPPDYNIFFPMEGSANKASVTPFVSTGVQVNYFVSDCLGFFAGTSFTYANPVFKKDLLYTEMVNGEPTLIRKHLRTNQEMAFFQFRLGIIVHLHFGDLF